MRNHLIVAVILSVMVIYLNLGNTGSDNRIAENTSPLENSEYDYFMNNIDNTVFSLTGERRYRVQAERLTHYPNGDITILEAPRFSVYPEEKQPWYISAENAQIEMDMSADEPRISLLENVSIEHTDDDGRALSIYTDSLVIYPEGKTLTSDQLVRINYPGFEITGTGMTADMNLNQLTLLTDVSARGAYE